MNPLPEACGAGFDLTVTPSAAQVDRDLPIAKLLAAALSDANLRCGALVLRAAANARADTRAGALGDAASAADYYQITCSDDGSGAPASLSVQVQDDAPRRSRRS